MSLMRYQELAANSSSMTAVMGGWEMRTVSTFSSTPSSRTRNLLAVRPGANWGFLSKMTLTSTLTIGTSTRMEKVSPPGFLPLGCSGATGAGGSSDSGDSWQIGRAHV